MGFFLEILPFFGVICFFVFSPFSLKLAKKNQELFAEMNEYTGSEKLQELQCVVVVDRVPVQLSSLCVISKNAMWSKKKKLDAP